MFFYNSLAIIYLFISFIISEEEYALNIIEESYKNPIIKNEQKYIGIPLLDSEEKSMT